MEEQLRLFTQYESEYCNKSTDVARKIEELSTLVGDQRRRKVSEVEYDVREAEQMIKRMELEVRSLAPGQAQNYQTKIRDYKLDLQSLKDRLKGASRGGPSAGSTRRDLGLGSGYSSTTSQRDEMLKATQQANQTTERLKHGRQQLLETEALGESVLEALGTQRDTLNRATTRMTDTKEQLGSSERILSRLLKRTKWTFWNWARISWMTFLDNASKLYVQRTSFMALESKWALLGKS